MEILGNRKTIFNTLLKRALLAKENYSAFAFFSGITERFIEPKVLRTNATLLSLELEIINATMLMEKEECELNENITIDIEVFFKKYHEQIISLIDEYILMMKTPEWIELNLPQLEWDLFSKVLLVNNIPEQNLISGTHGIIIDIHHNDDGVSYEVEFTDENGQILAQLEVKGDYLKRVN